MSKTKMTGVEIPKINKKAKRYVTLYMEGSGNGSSSGGATPVDPSNPPQSMAPDTIYNWGTLENDTIFPALEDSTTAGNVYCWFFYTGSTVPNITMPTGLTWVGGSEPTWAANKYYEITVMNNVATCLEA